MEQQETKPTKKATTTKKTAPKTGRAFFERLLAAQEAFGEIRKDGTVHLKRGSYGYATLDSILSTVGPALREQGLILWHDAKFVDNDTIWVICELRVAEPVPVKDRTEPDGLTVALPAKVSIANPQSLLGVITTLRRATVCMACGVTADESGDQVTVEAEEVQQQAINFTHWVDRIKELKEEAQLNLAEQKIRAAALDDEMNRDQERLLLNAVNEQRQRISSPVPTPAEEEEIRRAEAETAGELFDNAPEYS